MKYTFLLFFSGFTLIHQCCIGQLNPRDSKIINKFSRDLSDDIKKDNLHGSISVVAIKKRQVIWASALGYSNMEKDILADTGTIYRIASITKTFTATVLMQLVEEGKLRLDDPVESYVPEVKSLQGYSKNTKFTLRQLASHTSGLSREPNMSDANIGPTDQWEGRLLSCIPNTSFDGTPGRQFLYSNIGYAILGLALERAAGVPYIQMVQQRIFTPLQMSHTFFSVPDDMRERIAQGIDNKNDGRINTGLPSQQIEGMGYRVPNGGIWSTPLDLSKFVIALMGGYPLLKPESVRQMLVVQAGSKNYGLGIMIMNNRELDMIGHNGSDPGYTSQFSMDLKSGDAIILMRNYNAGTTNLEETSRYFLMKL
jgi:CubicO group peptidase (beta-lactamase class C family)